MREQLWWLIYSQYISQWKIKIYDMLPKSLQRQELLIALGRKKSLCSEWLWTRRLMAAWGAMSDRWALQNIYHHAPRLRGHRRREGRRKEQEEGEDLGTVTFSVWHSQYNHVLTRALVACLRLDLSIAIHGLGRVSGDPAFPFWIAVYWILREGKALFLVVYPLMSSPDSNTFQTHGYIDDPG